MISRAGARISIVVSPISCESMIATSTGTVVVGVVGDGLIGTSPSSLTPLPMTSTADAASPTPSNLIASGPVISDLTPLPIFTLFGSLASVVLRWSVRPIGRKNSRMSSSIGVSAGIRCFSSDLGVPPPIPAGNAVSDESCSVSIPPHAAPPARVIIETRSAVEFWFHAKLSEK